MTESCLGILHRLLTTSTQYEHLLAYELLSTIRYPSPIVRHDEIGEVEVSDCTSILAPLPLYRCYKIVETRPRSLQIAMNRGQFCRPNLPSRSSIVLVPNARAANSGSELLSMRVTFR